MKSEEENYKKVVNLLKTSKPRLDSTREIEEEVIRRISAEGKQGLTMSAILDYIFGWVYIGWVRRSLITASAFMIMVFIYQQGMIIGQIKSLSNVGEKAENVILTNSGSLNRELMTLKFGSNRLREVYISVPKEKMDSLLNSVNDLQEKYNDLKKLIESNPEQKRILEKRLLEIEKSKI
jgi:hypothetical protein